MDGIDGADGWVLKVSKDLFPSDVVGDILAFQCPEQQQATFPAGLCIIRRNGSNFDSNSRSRRH
ncbi:MAG: hypothetical protein ABSF95_05540 [Verrucomicrobiota bacterium]|jgi:hypothetical protein